MKTVFSRVMNGHNATEDGVPIDGIFGNVSIEDRKVLSPKKMGMANTLLKAISLHTARVYKGEANARRKQ